MIEIVTVNTFGTEGQVCALMVASEHRGSVVSARQGAHFSLTIETGDRAFRQVQSLLSHHPKRVEWRRRWKATDAEIASASLVSLSHSWWLELHESVDEPAFDAIDECPSCAKGGTTLTEPLAVDVERLRERHLVRVFPSLVVASREVVSLSQDEGWSGVGWQPIVDRRTKRETDEFAVAIVTAMSESASDLTVVRSSIPRRCEECSRIGYDLGGRRQVAYSKRAIEAACDWNMSTEWFGASFATRPDLLCRARVAQALNRIDDSLEWLPVIVDR